MLIHSKRIANRLLSEQVGVWLDNSANEPHLWVVAKLPMNLIREIDVGAAIALQAWVVENSDHLYAAFGLIINDNQEYPMTTHGVCRSTEEIDNLRTLLGLEVFPLQIHNENGLPVLNVQCRIAIDQAKSVRELLPTGPYPEGDGVALRGKVSDIIRESLEPEAAPDPRIKGTCTLPIAFEQTEKLDVHVMGSGPISLTDDNQGNELERLTFQQLEFLFPFGTYQSPEREHGTKGRLEVCDVLALSRIRECPEEGIFVIQNKVAPASAAGLSRTAKRRGLTIQKNIIEAIGQAVGAIQRLKAGVQVYHYRGDRIEIDPPEVVAAVEPLNLQERANQVGHGIVVISDMHEMVDWKLIWTESLDATKKTGYTFHVLDLRELQQFIIHADGRPAMFESFMIDRWEPMAALKSASVRARFKV